MGVAKNELRIQPKIDPYSLDKALEGITQWVAAKGLKPDQVEIMPANLVALPREMTGYVVICNGVTLPIEGLPEGTTALYLPTDREYALNQSSHGLRTREMLARARKAFPDGLVIVDDDFLHQQATGQRL